MLFRFICNVDVTRRSQFRSLRLHEGGGSFLLIKEIKTSGGSRPSDRGGEGVGRGHRDPEIRGWSGLKKHFFGPSSLSLV